MGLASVRKVPFHLWEPRPAVHLGRRTGTHCGGQAVG